MHSRCISSSTLDTFIHLFLKQKYTFQSFKRFPYYLFYDRISAVCVCVCIYFIRDTQSELIKNMSEKRISALTFVRSRRDIRKFHPF